MNKQLAHIFDDSVCLTKRQIKDYVSNHLSEEECHAIEVHLSSCPFCNEAIEGYFLYQTDLIMALSDLNVNFIHEHFQNSMLQVHLNSIAPSANVLTHKNKARMQPFRLKTLIAAFVLMGVGLMWYFEIGSNKNNPESKQQTITAQSAITPAENSIEPEPLSANSNNDQKAGNGGSPQRPQLLIGNDRPSEKEKNHSHEVATSHKANNSGIFKAKPEKKKEQSHKSSTSDGEVLKLKPSLTPEKEQAKPIEPLDKAEK